MTDENSTQKAVPIFEVKKKFSWKNSVIHYLEIILVLLVVSGTLLWVLFSFHFSFKDSANSILNYLKPKISSESAVKKETSQQQLERLINEQKLFETSEITTTNEGDFQVKSKDGLTVFFSATKNLSEQVATLQTLLTKAKIDNKAVKKVDFRFEKIIVEN